MEEAPSVAADGLKPPGECPGVTSPIRSCYRANQRLVQIREKEEILYIYNATVLKVVDGDTVHLMVDLGCDVNVKMTCRLAGINAPEMSTDAGKAAREFLVELLQGQSIELHTVKDRKEKYGRYLAHLILDDGTFAEDWMVRHGHAVRVDYGR